MILRRFALFSLLAVFTVTSGARAVDRVKLRKAVFLPATSIEVGYQVNGFGEFEAICPQPPPIEKIAAIEKELKGDASDAERYSRLARLYSHAGQQDKATNAYRKAVSLFRKQVKEYPNDYERRVRLAIALENTAEVQEAEALLRQAVKDHPNDYRAWLALGGLLGDKPIRAMTGGKRFAWSSKKAILQAIRAIAPTAEQIAAYRRQLKEAFSCFDRAVAVALGEPEVYRQRGAFRFTRGYLDLVLRSCQGEKLDLDAALFELGAQADMRRVVELVSDEYMGIGMVVALEVTADAYQYHLRHPSAKAPGKLLDVLSDFTRKQFRRDIARLEKAIENPDKRKGAEAAEVLGVLQMKIAKDLPAAEKSARRSIALDPTRDTAWDMLFALLMTTKEYRKAADLCRQRLEREDTPRNRMLLAKAHEKLDELDRAEAVIRVGLNHEPDDFELNLALADLLMKRGDANDLTQAGQILKRLGKGGFSCAGGYDPANYVCAVGVYCGLTGERETARQWLADVQKHEPKYPHIKEALEALDAPDKAVSSQSHP